MSMSAASPLLIVRETPTAANPNRRVLHRVNQSLWLALFGRPRTLPPSPLAGQRPHDTSQSR